MTMTFEEAQKKVQTLKRQPTWLKITFAYRTLVLPYKDGMALISALEQAEELENEWSKPAMQSMSSSSVTINPLSHEDYCNYKMAALMNLTFEEMKKMSDAA